MPRWTVRVADRASGQIRSLVVDAADADVAGREAMTGGMIVVDVRPAPADAPGPAVVASGPPPPVVPTYEAILTGAQALDRLAGIVRRVANVCFAVGIGVVLVAGYAWLAGQGAKAIELGTLYALSAVLYGVSLLVMATVLRLLGALSMAVRDMARNSFRDR